MRPEQSFRQAASAEKRKTQQHRITHAAPEGTGDIGTGWDALDQDGVDAYTDHDEECLETQRQ